MKAETKSKHQKKKSKKKDNHANKKSDSSGNNKTDRKDASSTAKSSLPTASPLRIGPVYYLVAILSFIAGVCTPPLYSKYDGSKITVISGTGNTASKTTEEKVVQVVTKTDEESDMILNTTETETETATETETDTTTTPVSETTIYSRNHVECNADHLSQFLHDEPMKGLHILCFPNKQQEHDQNGDDNQNSQIKIYKYAYDSNGNSEDTLQHNLPRTFQGLKQYLSTSLNIERYSRASMTQPWAIYSTTGKKLVGELDRDMSKDYSIDNIMDRLQSHGMVLLFEGGSWLWPGVRIGFRRTIEISNVEDGENSSTEAFKNSQSQNITLETLSLFPLVLSVKDFISEEECTHVQKKADPQMEYSEVSLMDKDKDRPASDFRTSQSAFVDSFEDDIMTRLEHRTASLTRVPRVHQEHTQVLRYGEQQKYDAHLDWFDRDLYLKDQITLRLIDNGRKNRLVTVFWYLSDVEEGGHTVFPRFGKAPQPWNFSDCTKGLLVKPQRGKVIVFYSLTPDGKGDQLSLHGACKVEKGIKWAANKWVWNTPQNFIRQ